MHRDLVLIALFSLVAGAGARVCPTLDIRNSPESLEKLRNCTVIMGNLKIVLIEKGEDESVFEGYSFPELTEIVDYLLVYKVAHLTTLGRLFPNLRVIRGKKMFHDCALVLYRLDHLEEIGLYNLEYIGRGGIIVDSCPKLCYVRSIDWQGMGASNLNFPLTGESESCKYKECHKSCLGYCWNREICQKRTFDYCKYFEDDGECVETCPKTKVINYDSMKCMSRGECETILNGTWWVFGGTCIGECPTFYNRDTTIEGGCRFIGRNFTKECSGGTISKINELEAMRGCTHIKGKLEILVSNTDVERQLEENLGNIVSISGFLKIGRTKSITSLEFLKNLTIIKGEKIDNITYSLFVFENENLRKLWNIDDNFKLTIPNGNFSFHDNPLLCLSEIEKFENAKTIRGNPDRHISKNSNGYKSFCNQKDLNITILEKNPTDITIAWERKYTQDELVIGYTLYYMSAPAGSDKVFSTSHSSDACTRDTWEGIFVRENQLQLKELSPFTRYAFYIKTYTTAQRAEQTPINYFITESSEPSEPVDLVADAVSDGSIFLKWKPPNSTNGHLTHYRVFTFIEEDYLPLIQQRNYCDFPHVVELKEEETTTPGALILNSTKPDSCNCLQKSFTEVITEDMKCIESRSLETCMKNIYYPQTNSFPAMHEIHKSSKKREVPLSNHDFNHVVVPATETSYLFQDLKHFSIYVFYVQACNTKDSVDVLCGSSMMTSKRTKKKESADIIRDLSVKTEKRDAFVTWSEPEEVNSVLVAYQIEYRRTDSEYSKPRFDCITEEQYKNLGRVFKILKLTSGDYAIHVQAISLAGPGKFSEWKYFVIAAEATFVLPILLPIVLVFVLGVVTAVGYIMYRRKKARLNNHLITSINPDYAGPVYVEDQWELDRDDVELIKEIGGGTFGMVYQGFIKSKRHHCAVKTINSDASMSDRMEFLNEGSVMKSFSDAHHVVKLLGIVSRGQPPLVVMELMERGDLKSYLRRCREPSQSLPTNELYRMAAEIADGMAYLSAKKFVHRDLAARNCMVAADHTVKIGDFGMARDVYETDYYRKGTAGLLPVRWMSPESLADGVFTTDSDVWSYGVVLWEMATYAEQPYQGFSNEEVFNFVKTGGKLSRPKECSDFFFEVMDSCWKWRPIDRPTFLDIVNMLVGHVGEGFKVAAFCFSRQGTELRLNAGPRVYNTPAMVPETEEDFFGHYDASEEEVNLYMRDSDRPMRYLPSSRQGRHRSSPYHISPGSPSSAFSFDSS